MKEGFPKEEDSVPSPPDDAASGKPPFPPVSPCTGDYKGRARVLTRWTKKSGSSQKTNHQIKKQGEDSTRNYGCEGTIETSSSLSLTSDTLPSSGHSASKSTISILPSDDAPQSIDQGLHESLSSLGSTCDGNIFSDDDDQPQKKDTKNSGAAGGAKRNDGNDKAGSPRYRGSVSNYFHSGCNVLPKAIGMFNEDDLNVPEPVRSIHPNFGGASSFSQPHHPKPPLIIPPAHRVPSAHKTTIVMHFSAKINNDNIQDDTSQERSPVNEAKHGSETSHNSSEEPVSQQHFENYPSLLEDADTEHTRNTREEVTQSRPNRNNLQEALLGSIRSRDTLSQARATNDSPNAGERTPATSGQSYQPPPRPNPTSRPSTDATYTASAGAIPSSDEWEHLLPTSTNSSSSTEVTRTNQSAFRPHYPRQSSADRRDFDSHEISPSREYARRNSLPSQPTAYFQQGLPVQRGRNPPVTVTSTRMSDQSALPPMHHHHQQRQHSAERALLQRQQGQLELQEQRRQAAAALDPHAEVFIQIPQQGQGNAIQVPLRRAHEVQFALEQDFYETPVCPCCSRRLAVIADAAYLYCPICTEISPRRGNIIAVGDFREEPEYLRRGLGLGMTWETLKKVHQEMFPQEYKNQRR